MSDLVVPGYKILKHVAKGMFGSVYLAHPEGHPNHLIAIKVYKISELNGNPKLAEKVQDEILALTTLEHKNILQMYQQIITDKHRFLVMDYCDGGDLENLLFSRKVPLSESELKQYFFELLQG